ncbi:RNA polymerase sigma factor [Paenibacillus sp. GCM10012303]|uniref:RNA polymerase sigma factor n=1 Tax=Paenibacillus sp. GCM10012303 TaxID=3317340 RepID=UPI00360D5970
MEINELLEDVRRGNVDSFEPVIRMYEKNIYRFCFFMLGNRQEAEDAAQDVFFKAYRHLGGYDERQTFKAWLYKIAENHCHNVLKRRWKWLRLLPLFRSDGRTESAEQAYSEQMGTEMAFWFKDLSLPEKKLLFLRVVEECSFDEIAQMMGESAPTLRKRFERLKRKLRAKKMQEEEMCDERRLELR